MQATAVVASDVAAVHATVGLQLVVEKNVVTDPVVDHANILEWLVEVGSNLDTDDRSVDVLPMHATNPYDP